MVVGIVNKIELIFNMHKEDIVEDTIRYKSDISKKYGLDVDATHDLFAKIINYQIDKYGYQKTKYTEDLTRDTFYHKRRKAEQRKYKRTN
jgi:hypothetical protein